MVNKVDHWMSTNYSIRAYIVSVDSWVSMYLTMWGWDRRFEENVNNY